MLIWGLATARTAKFQKYDVVFGRDEESHIQPAAGVADEVNLICREAAALYHLIHQPVGLVGDGTGGLRGAFDNLCLDVQAFETRLERIRHAVEIVDGAQSGEAEKARNQVYETFSHGVGL